MRATLSSMLYCMQDDLGAPHWGNTEPEQLYGKNGWCESPDPELKCACLTDGMGGPYCELVLEQVGWSRMLSPFCSSASCKPVMTGTSTTMPRLEKTQVLEYLSNPEAALKE